MSPPPKKPLEPWQRLQTSPDLINEIHEIYGADFLKSFASRFDRKPEPHDLLEGVTDTACAYVTGKWGKAVDKSKLLKYSGIHLIGAGLSARRLSYELRQIAKSERASHAVYNQLRAKLAAHADRPFAANTYTSAMQNTGPRSRLTVIQELASALEDAIDDIIPLPVDYADEAGATQRAFDFVTDNNNAAEKLLPKSYPMEAAAGAFKPIWERFSTVAYRRGRFDHTRGGYNSEAGSALFLIVSKLDSNVAESLARTAIENVRRQELLGTCSD